MRKGNRITPEGLKIPGVLLSGKKRIAGKAILLIILLPISIFFTFMSINIFFQRKSFVSPLALGILASDDSSIVTQTNEKLKRNSIDFTKIEQNGDDIIIFLKDKGMVYISMNKDIDKQIGSLQVILSRLTMEGRWFKRLDLRFDNPVIVF